MCNSGIEFLCRNYIIGPKEMARGLFNPQDLHFVITCICDRIKTALLVISNPRRVFKYLGPTFVRNSFCLIHVMRLILLKRNC